MKYANDLINQKIPHINTNTLVFIIIAIIAFYILVKVVSKIVKIVAVLAICWFVLMSVQSTNIANIPIVKQVYNGIEKVIPSKELWSKASGYINDANKVNKVINDIKSTN